MGDDYNMVSEPADSIPRSEGVRGSSFCNLVKGNEALGCPGMIEHDGLFKYGSQSLTVRR
jgi:hypothetical protein